MSETIWCTNLELKYSKKSKLFGTNGTKQQAIFDPEIQILFKVIFDIIPFLNLQLNQNMTYDCHKICVFGKKEVWIDVQDLELKGLAWRNIPNCLGQTNISSVIWRFS